MELNYIVVQAGGRGSRMEMLTKNKPKALVPVENLPILFHLFKAYPDKKYVIIADYKEDVLKKYLETFAEVDYKIVSGNGKKGTLAGLSPALELIPENERFLLIWCDLILGKDHTFLETDEDVIGIAKDFSCRWSFITPPPRKGMRLSRKNAPVAA